MATFGANYPVFCPNGAVSGYVLGKLVSANLSITLASGEIYADDGLAEQASEFASGSIAMETDDMTDQLAAILYGATMSGNKLTYNKDDNAPTGKLAYYKAGKKNGVRYYRAIGYKKVSAALGNDNAQTKGSSITFASVPTTFTVFADDNGDWRDVETFSTAAAAKAWCQNFCNVGTNYEIDVSVQGAEGTEKAAPTGISFVAAAGSFVLNITGTPTKLYDNGSDVTSSIADNKYTLSNVSANHTIAVIF